MPSQEIGTVEMFIPHLDKVVHMVLFGGVVVTFGWAFRHQPFEKNATLIFVMTILSSVYGISMEFVQKYALKIPRDYDEWDMLADTIGAFVGFFFVRAVILWCNRRGKVKRSN